MGTLRAVNAKYDCCPALVFPYCKYGHFFRQLHGFATFAFEMLLFIDCSQTMCEGKKYIISGAHAFIRVAFIADFSLARVAAPNKPSAKRADDNRLYKTNLPLDIDNRSGRQGIREGRVVIGHGPEGLQPVAHEVDVQVLRRVHAEV